MVRIVLVFDVVGLCDVFQHIPLCVIVDPPLERIVPPLMAELDVTPLMGLVVREAMIACVVNESSFP